MRGSINGFLTLFIMILFPTVLLADTAPSSFDEHYARAKRLFAGGRYEECIEELKSAYAIEADPDLLLNQGHAWRKLRRYDEALRDYHRYYELVKDPSARAKAERHIADVTYEKKKLEEQLRLEQLRRQREATLERERNQRVQHLLDNENKRTLPKPLVKKWWFWTAIGGGIALSATGAILASRPWDRAPSDLQVDNLHFSLR